MGPEMENGSGASSFIPLQLLRICATDLSDAGVLQHFTGNKGGTPGQKNGREVRLLSSPAGVGAALTSLKEEARWHQ